MDDRNKASYSTGLASHWYAPDGWFLDAENSALFPWLPANCETARF